MARSWCTDQGPTKEQCAPVSCASTRRPGRNVTVTCRATSKRDTQHTRRQPTGGTSRSLRGAVPDDDALNQRDRRAAATQGRHRAGRHSEGRVVLVVVPGQEPLDLGGELVRAGQLSRSDPRPNARRPRTIDRVVLPLQRCHHLRDLLGARRPARRSRARRARPRSSAPRWAGTGRWRRRGGRPARARPAGTPRGPGSAARARRTPSPRARPDRAGTRRAPPRCPARRRWRTATRDPRSARAGCRAPSPRWGGCAARPSGSPSWFTTRRTSRRRTSCSTAAANRSHCVSGSGPGEQQVAGATGVGQGDDVELRGRVVTSQWSVSKRSGGRRER